MTDINIPRSIFAKHQPKAAATDRVPAGKVTEFQLAFRAFDTQQSDQLSYRAVKVALRALGFLVKKQEVLRLLDKHSRGSTGVQLTVFEAVCSDLYLSRSPEDELQQGFQLFDLDNSGHISLENLSDIVSELGLVIPKSALLEMIAEFDADKDGQISQREFQYIMSLQ